MTSEGARATYKGFRFPRRVRTLAITLLSLLALSFGSAQSYEVGYHLDYRGSAAFIYISNDFNLGYWGSVGIWASPSVELTFSPRYLEGWAQLQFLIDAPIATLSVRGKYELIDSRTRGEFRVGMLIGN